MLDLYLQSATISHEAVPAESELEQFSLEMKSVVQVTLHAASSAKNKVRGNVVNRATETVQRFFSKQHLLRSKDTRQIILLQLYPSEDVYTYFTR